MISPCKDCDHRILNCHDSCEPYLIWAKKKKEYSRKLCRMRLEDIRLDRQEWRRQTCINNGSLGRRKK